MGAFSHLVNHARHYLHAKYEVAPVVEVVVPAGHGVHVPVPVKVAYVPRGQSIQGPPPEEYLPGEHCTQDK